MRAATRTVSAQSAGSYRTGCASSVRRRRFVDRNRANGFRSGCPAARLRGPSRGAWKIFRKKDRLYSVAFFADRMRKRNPYPVFPSIVSLRSTFSLHSVPGSAAVCGTGSVRTRYFCYICSRRIRASSCRRYRAPSYRIIFNNIRSMKNFVRMAAVCFAAAGLFAGCNDDETPATAESVVLDKPAITLEVGDREQLKAKHQLIR